MDVETALQGAHDLQEALLGDVEVAQAGEATVPEGITYKLPLPPPGVEIHTYVKESIKVVYILVLH